MIINTLRSMGCIYFKSSLTPLSCKKRNKIYIYIIHMLKSIAYIEIGMHSINFPFSRLEKSVKHFAGYGH